METQRISLDDRTKIPEGYLIPLPATAKNMSIDDRTNSVVRIGDFCTIGRDLTCQLVITDGFVSSRHARIERKNGVFSLRDLHSRNGSYLNGSRVVEAVLTPHDRLQFGESTFLFSAVSPDTPLLSSKSKIWNDQLQRLPALAATDFSILITGPSGSGKEILARALHDQSQRAQGPFVSINCSALTESLIESELFGHVRGSFTGAANDRKGAFETARLGTLFLDEIGDLPMSLQPKLLRALENNEIRPVGSDRSIETDVRIVAATHKNIPMSIRNGKFREDLFYRLNVCQIRPPSLKERMEDFEDLVYEFARQYRTRFSFNAIQKLKDHPWNGNVRELKNVIARASAYFPGHHIQPEDLAQILETPGLGPEVHFVSENTQFGAELPQSSVIRDIEKDMIIRRLTANQGNQRQTARDLGLPKSTLHDRIRSYGIDLSQFTVLGRST